MSISFNQSMMSQTLQNWPPERAPVRPHTSPCARFAPRTASAFAAPPTWQWHWPSQEGASGDKRSRPSRTGASAGCKCPGDMARIKDDQGWKVEPPGKIKENDMEIYGFPSKSSKQSWIFHICRGSLEGIQINHLL